MIKNSIFSVKRVLTRVLRSDLRRPLTANVGIFLFLVLLPVKKKK